MAHLYLFNPDHDMALANFTPYYKTTSEIIRMANDLSTLPAWYAEEGSWVKTDMPQRGEQLDRQCLAGGIKPAVQWSTEYSSMPYAVWGWNPALVHVLRQVGVEEMYLPDGEKLKKLRYLSGRQRCKEVLAGMVGLPHVCGASEVCISLEEVLAFVGAHEKTILKAPWSGSGRGLAHVFPDSWSDSVAGWTARVIRTQGAIIAEPYYNKVVDFAMEFHIESGVSFAGYSLFETDTHGNYKENLLLSDEEIERRLAQYIPLEILHRVRSKLIHIFSVGWAQDYMGYLGVDMMICREGDDWQIHPCVEVNLRMNMGVVSRLIYDRYVHPSAQGRYVVEHYGTDGTALEFHREMMERYPLYKESGRIRRGYLSLTPVFENTRYQVYIHIG